MKQNVILELCAALEMDPHGVFTGLIGAALSLFVVNGNSFTLRRAGLTVVAGLGVCGYSIQYLDTVTELRAVALMANIAVSYLLVDVLNSVKTKAPTLTNLIIDAFTIFAKRFFPDSDQGKS
jgi:hypothetical protein